MDNKNRVTALVQLLNFIFFKVSQLPANLTAVFTALTNKRLAQATSYQRVTVMIAPILLIMDIRHGVSCRPDNNNAWGSKT